jgi:Phasin protein
MAARAGKSGSVGSATAKQTPTELLKAGEAQTEAMLAMQKELAQTYEQISRTWLDRMKSEAELWSELAAKMSGAKSVPDAMACYQEFMAKRMQMAADDGRRIFDDSQKVMNAITRAMANRLPTAST